MPQVRKFQDEMKKNILKEKGDHNKSLEGERFPF